MQQQYVTIVLFHVQRQSCGILGIEEFDCTGMVSIGCVVQLNSLLLI